MEADEPHDVPAEGVGDDEEEIQLDDMEEIVMDDEVPPEFSDDDDMGASGDEDGEGGMGEPMDEEVIDEAEMVLVGHTDPIYQVAYHPNNTEMVATAGGDDVCGIYDVTSAERLHTLSGHTDTVNLVAFSKDGAYLATGSLDATVRVWNAGDGTYDLVNHLQGPAEDILWLTWHPKGNILLAGSADCTCWMWSVPKGKEMQCFAGHAGAVLCGGFTPDGKLVVTGSEDCAVRVWNPKTGASKLTLKDKQGGMDFHSAPITCMDLAADSKNMLTGSADHSVILSNIVSGKMLHRFEAHTDGIEAVGFCACMPLFLSASLDSTVRVWDLAAQAERGMIQHKDSVVVARWHPSLPILFTGSMDRTVQVVDARDTQCLQLFTGHRDTVLDVVLSPAGDALLTGADDHTSRLFRLPPLPAGAVGGVL